MAQMRIDYVWFISRNDDFGVTRDNVFRSRPYDSSVPSPFICAIAVNGTTRSSHFHLCIVVKRQFR